MAAFAAGDLFYRLVGLGASDYLGKQLEGGQACFVLDSGVGQNGQSDHQSQSHRSRRSRPVRRRADHRQPPGISGCGDARFGVQDPVCAEDRNQALAVPRLDGRPEPPGLDRPAFPAEVQSDRRGDGRNHAPRHPDAGLCRGNQHGRQAWLLPFKSTPFEAAAEQGLPIQPTLLFFESTPADGNGGPLSWHGDYTLLPHIWRILGLKEIRADVHVLPVIRPEPGEDRKHLANRVHDFMEEEYWRIMNRG